MNLKEQVFFFKRLAFLSNAHMPLVESLEVLRKQTRRKRHVQIFDSILSDIREGQTLSRAFGKYPAVFSALCVSVVQVGESSGSLSLALEHLAGELKKKQILRAKMVGAFIYPAVVTCATLGITVFLMLFLFPKITPIFKSLHAHLPLSTRIVMASSTFLMYWGVLVFAVGAALLIAIFLTYKRSVSARLCGDTLALRLPLVGTMLQLYTLSNTSRTLGTLLSSGMSLSHALEATTNTTSNLVYKGEFKKLQRVVAHGERLSSYLEQRPALFPYTLSHMVAVGERSGTLSQTLLYVAEQYDAEVDEITKNISTLIEPLLMVCMGVLVGFIAVSIITPIYAITQNLHT